MPNRTTGQEVTVATAGESFRAYVPAPLPPEPDLVWDQELRHLAEQAAMAVGRLDGISALLPQPDIFLYAYVRKEAVVSSQIEGTQSSLSDLLLYEQAAAPGVPVDDVQEVSNYVAALNHGLKRLREGFPLSLRLIQEIHAILMSGVRGGMKSPGEFRRSQNWIGGSRPGTARFVPPPPDELMNCLGALEKFMHDDPVATPALIKAALVHVQFETIHPFLDGNGRLGRLLITFLLCAEGVLNEPLLYLSLYFKENRSEYYDHLQSVRRTGDWEGWMRFFLRGVKQTADQAVSSARRLRDLFAADLEKITAVGRAAANIIRIHQQLQLQPVTSVNTIAAKLDMAVNTARSALTQMQTLGIVREITGGKYGRLYAYDAYLTILSEGTEPLRR
jgi:Fic family protein